MSDPVSTPSEGDAEVPAGKVLMTQQRRDRIAAAVQREGTVRVTELAGRFAVSEVTIRSDLVILEREGHVVRDRGGAVAKDRSRFVTTLARVDERSGVRLDEKRRIGAAAAARVVPGDAIILDAGTTAVEIARQLVAVSPLTVVTNALNVATVLADARGHRLLLLGGTFNRESASTVGAFAEQNLAELSVQKLFLGTQAMDEAEGLSDSTMEIAQVKRAMIRAARQVILVTDSSKWGRASLTRVAPLAEIDTIITDDGLPPAAREAIEKLGIELVIV